MTEALLPGLLAGYGIAMPVGAMTVLILTLSARNSLAYGLAAGLGTATADGLYALLAVLGGAALASAIEPAASWLQVAAAVVLAGIAAKGLADALRQRRTAAGAGTEEGSRQRVAADRSLGRTYFGVLGLTMLNPTTVVYFAALVIGGQSTGEGSFAAGGVFVAAATVASASWQVMLALGGAAVGRVLTGPRGRLWTALVGNSVILLLAARLAWTA
ncbi:LysE family transporter [Yinghuangia seranimata]|uniref:LysE family transporter n=1 Tax=Yinghuangia seranimata TaxID=408067 RepID=UPI00248C1270|nr:LysE family transporter [Yinghuangia seranimata]MDI2131364.1 LysE family transporter [Yinghuangia seranimata]